MSVQSDHIQHADLAIAVYVRAEIGIICQFFCFVDVIIQPDHVQHTRLAVAVNIAMRANFGVLFNSGICDRDLIGTHHVPRLLHTQRVGCRSDRVETVVRGISRYGRRIFDLAAIDERERHASVLVEEALDGTGDGKASQIAANCAGIILAVAVLILCRGLSAAGIADRPMVLPVVVVM